MWGKFLTCPLFKPQVENLRYIYELMRIGIRTYRNGV